MPRETRPGPTLIQSQLAREPWEGLKVLNDFDDFNGVDGPLISSSH